MSHPISELCHGSRVQGSEGVCVAGVGKGSLAEPTDPYQNPRDRSYIEHTGRVKDQMLRYLFSDTVEFILMIDNVHGLMIEAAYSFNS